MVNKVILIGNLGQDPKVISNIPDSPTVVKFTLATKDRWRSRDSGEMEERTEWHNIVAFGKLADICVDLLHKGKQIYVEGRLSTSSWTQGNFFTFDDDNFHETEVKRWKTEIVIQEMWMLGNKHTHISEVVEDKDDDDNNRDDEEEDDIPF